MKKHSKHSKLTKRNNDLLAPNEISILGVKCSVISELIANVSKKLSSKLKIAYIDASHNKEILKPVIDTYTFHDSGNLDINKHSELNSYNEKIRFNSYDLVFVNGNHFEGKKQIVFLDKEKENSIIKRLDEINDVLFSISNSEGIELFDCLKTKFPNYSEIPVFKLEDLQSISDEIEKKASKTKPALNALVLIGGKSTRMGEDKAKLDYHGKEHSTYLAELFKNKGLKTYLSAREKQEADFPLIEDKFLDLGPFGAICSAFMENPNEAYFVVATDLPFINNELIDLLIKNRDTRKIATTVKGKSKQFPEPLITIWEPKSYPILLNYLAQGFSCPRKVLINSEVKIIEVEDKLITNVNTPEEYKDAKKTIN